MAISVDNLRRGKKYRLTNYGEQFEFQVMDIADEEVFVLKDLHTLDLYKLHDLVKYGKGKDFDLEEM
ncbi:hypothetical protein [uncultured Pontibacter sp.]|uniref:hypothetical protein n=1 Tax=uncultured Pontibacter sp. TaxID=453356 RepID=UPI002606C849|nr:hypothetical protein [uncultured Pontibacter sp.]